MLKKIPDTSNRVLFAVDLLSAKYSADLFADYHSNRLYDIWPAGVRRVVY
jgi:hypothetical protein